MKLLECRQENVEYTLKYASNTTSSMAFDTSAKQLDSSLKKNSAMVTKLKSITADTYKKVIEELSKLNFEKFIGEYVQSIAECALKMRSGQDIQALLMVLSHLHQRSSECSGPFLAQMLRTVLKSAMNVSVVAGGKSQQGPAGASTGVDMLQIRSAVRVLVEFLRNGFVDISGSKWKAYMPQTTPSTLPSMQTCIEGQTMKDLLSTTGGYIYLILHLYLIIHKPADDDLESENPSAVLATSFVKFCQDDYLVASGQPGEDVVDSRVRSALTHLIQKSYYDDILVARLSKTAKSLRKLKSYYADYQITRGQLSDDQKQKLELLKKSFESQQKTIQAISDSLQLTVPKVTDEDEDDAGSSKTSAVQIVDIGAKFASMAAEKDWWQTPWDDLETFNFYNDIPDLMNHVSNHAVLSASTLPAPYVSPPQKSSKGNNKAGKAKLGGGGRKGSSDAYDNYGDDDYYLSDESENEKDFEYVNRELVKQSLKESDADEAQNTSQSSTSATSGAPLIISGNVSVDTVLLNLPNLINVKLLDQAVVDFCNVCDPRTLQDSIGRLIRLFVTVHRFRTDVLPYYSRFIATVNKYWPQVGQTVVACLLGEFRRRYWREASDHINQEHRSKNVRFLGELVKFQICPTYVIFYCFKRLSQPEASNSFFSAHHILVASHLLESCGRFMCKTPQIAKKWNPLVEIFEKKCKAVVGTMDSHVRLVVQNALLAANPPLLQPLNNKNMQVKLTPIEHFMNHLFYERLKPSSIHVVLDLLRSLPWKAPIEQEVLDLAAKSTTVAPPQPQQDNENNENKAVLNTVAAPKMRKVDCRKFLLQIFTQPWKVRFNQLELFANLLNGLHRYHSDFAVEVVDDVLEEIRYGLEEHTHFQFQQRRVSLVRYLGHLFNARVASLGCIFNTLYMLITFGYPSGKPSRTSESPLDPSNDFFRIRLVAEMLDTSVGPLLKAVRGRGLDDFLVYYQYYIFTKNTDEMPFEVRFIVDDVFQKIMTLSSSTKSHSAPVPCVANRFKNYEEAELALLEIEKSTFGKSSNEVEEEEMDVDRSSIEHDDNDGMDGEDGEEEVQPVDNQSKTQKVPEKYVLTREEEEAFAREFQEMLSESIAGRKNEKKIALDVHLPLALKSQSSSSSMSIQKEKEPEEKKVKFRVLTKGKSVSSSITKDATISVPANSAIAISTLTNQENLKREQAQIKNRVLAIQSRSDD